MLTHLHNLFSNLLPKLSEINYSGHPYYDRSASTNTIETLSKAITHSFTRMRTFLISHFLQIIFGLKTVTSVNLT